VSKSDKDVPCSNELSASSKKLKTKSSCDSAVKNNQDFDGYILLDKTLVFSFLEQYLCCVNCHNAISITAEKESGLLMGVKVICVSCQTQRFTRNSKMVGSKYNASDINRRFTLALRSIGKGHAESQTFCAVMDLPTPLSQKAYDKVVRHIHDATWNVAEKSMKEAVQQEIVLNGSHELTVSGDGTWKTRGHSSRFGVTTLIGGETGKVVDRFVSCSYCKGCEAGEKIKKNCSSDHYKKWQTKHQKECSINHSGSAGKMEVNGMVNMFSRSDEKYGARYINYIGDGDTKTYQAVLKEDPYGVPIKKIECVGHVQKRMGSRLRKLKDEYRGKKLCDKKPLSGKGRLTDVVIDQLTTYYGNAIRKYPDSVRGMQRAIWAIWYHKRSNDGEVTHDMCPSGKDSWCAYQKAVAAGTHKSFKHTKPIPSAVMDVIKPVFKDLSHPDLLKRCVGGRTQNANESLNGLIWKFCPKTSNSGRHIVTIAVNIAVACFNDGKQAFISIFKELGLACGQSIIDHVAAADELRMKTADKRKSDCSFSARIAKRQKKKKENENNIIEEGQFYNPGAF
jgi:hypothetical protein